MVGFLPPPPPRPRTLVSPSCCPPIPASNTTVSPPPRLMSPPCVDRITLSGPSRSASAAPSSAASSPFTLSSTSPTPPSLYSRSAACSSPRWRSSSPAPLAPAPTGTLRRSATKLPVVAFVGAAQVWRSRTPMRGPLWPNVGRLLLLGGGEQACSRTLCRPSVPRLPCVLGVAQCAMVVCGCRACHLCLPGPQQLQLVCGARERRERDVYTPPPRTPTRSNAALYELRAATATYRAACRGKREFCRGVVRSSAVFQVKNHARF